MAAAKSEKGWTLKKDGLWLMSCRPGSIREYSQDGVLIDVPICLWGEKKNDALVIEHEYRARDMARILGAELFAVGVRGRGGVKKVEEA